MSAEQIHHVYNCGMRYIQKAMNARIAGDNEAAEEYIAKFKKLCQYASTGIDKVPEANDIKTFGTLEKINTGLQTLKDHIPIITKTKDNTSIKNMKQALEISQNSCAIYAKSIEKRLIPPELTTGDLDVMQAVKNEDIPITTLRCCVSNIGAPQKKGITYTVNVYSIARETPPKTSEPLDAGAVDWHCDWNILKRSNPKLMQRLAERKEIGFELVMHDKGLFKTTVVPVGHCKVPIGIVSKLTEVTKTYPLDPTEHTPKGEQFSLEISLKVNTPILEPCLKVLKLNYLRVKPGSSFSHFPEPNVQQEKPVKPVQVPAAAPKKKSGLKQMSEMSKEEVYHLCAKIPKFGDIPFKLLDDWELERWMSLKLIDKLIEVGKLTTDAFIGCGVEPTPKLEEMQKKLQEKRNLIGDQLKSQKISVIDYYKKIAAQVVEDEKEAKVKGLETPAGKGLMHRASIMRAEYQEKLNKQKAKK
ncbi:hypothetical protein TVAG_181750 [Trichomonas vaginalis G3]|uniref:Uncharacterized protein n=1 Tax=Trichomonas vaginalis (strain ATCC PRA-98 / G3) TaxID=412133 RepID=A2GAI5_TRIV3|nr:hypothetical protein TVAGG3_0570500 [Trichomonas vaginalis G3]EAX85833.1 hypothetical protein TVAG_181750 [Trichomonas vaginalis G3]KAI5521872.1 hypothetical protein TVAGG3_0570500 [Trichomonas vaginalis G3]|eukprot:XP_001298763.1 hypothetical protein [Trichomonas vaginalis G3]